jgi:predicted lipoprotein with Yx(FWY)xxD motif
MRSRYMILLVMVALTIAASACSTQSAPTAAAPAQSSAAAPAVPSGPAMVSIGKAGSLGSFLVDEKGMTLYLFTKDTPGTSTCYDKCAAAWPALLTAGTPTAGNGVDPSKFGTTTRTEGSKQVTYNGWPLYYFAKDKQPGDTTGQGVGSVWYVVAPTGNAVK